MFLINIPSMILLLALAPVLLPEYRNPIRGRFDFASAVLSIAAVLPIIWGIKEIAAHGADLVRVAAIVGGLVIVAAFVRRQRRSADPMLDLAILFAPRRSVARSWSACSACSRWSASRCSPPNTCSWCWG